MNKARIKDGDLFLDKDVSPSLLLYKDREGEMYVATNCGDGYMDYTIPLGAFIEYAKVLERKFQPYKIETKEDKMDKIDGSELVQKVIEWGRDKGLDDPKAQLNKVVEELGEVAHEITRNHYDTPELVDAIGDTLVTVVILSDILHLDPMECLQSAYNEIANRKGKTENGTFIKDNQ